MQAEPITLHTSDGIDLNGLIFRPEQPQSATVVHPATGVPFKYYLPFAEWLSKTHNRTVLIYAYRDSENPTPAELRQSKTVMSDWGIHDQSAALDYLIENVPELEIHTIGHSLGGFCVPFHQNAHQIVSHTGVNSGLAYWPTHPWSYIFQVIMFWFVLGPIATKVLGYLPGQFLGMKNGLPAGVYWQWRNWCTHRDFYKPEWGTALPTPDLQRFRGKLKLFSCSDDVTIPTSRVKALTRFYPVASSTEIETLNPKDFGLKSIGHIPIFSSKCHAVWPTLIG